MPISSNKDIESKASHLSARESLVQVDQYFGFSGNLAQHLTRVEYFQDQNKARSGHGEEEMRGGGGPGGACYWGLKTGVGVFTFCYTS